MANLIPPQSAPWWDSYSLGHSLDCTQVLQQAVSQSQGTLTDTVEAFTALSGLPPWCCYGFSQEAAFTDKPCIQQRLHDCTVQLLAKNCTSKAWLDHLQLAEPSQSLLPPTAAAADPLDSIQLDTKATSGLHQVDAVRPSTAHLPAYAVMRPPQAHNGRPPKVGLCTKAAASQADADWHIPATLPSSADAVEPGQSSIALAVEALLRIKDVSQSRAMRPLTASAAALVQTGANQALTASGSAHPASAHQDTARQPAQLGDAIKHQDSPHGSSQHRSTACQTVPLSDDAVQRIVPPGQPAQLDAAGNQCDGATLPAQLANAPKLHSQPAASLTYTDISQASRHQAAAHPSGPGKPPDSTGQPAPQLIHATHPSSRDGLSAQAAGNAGCRKDDSMPSVSRDDMANLLLQSLDKLQKVTLKAMHAAGCCDTEPPFQQGSQFTLGRADSQAGPGLQAKADPRPKSDPEAKSASQAAAGSQAKFGSQGHSISKSSVRCSSRLGDLKEKKPEVSLNRAPKTRLQQLKAEASQLGPRRYSAGDAASIGREAQQRRRSCQPPSNSQQLAHSNCSGQKRKRSMSVSSRATKRKVSWVGPDADTGHTQAVHRLLQSMQGECGAETRSIKDVNADYKSNPEYRLQSGYH